MAIDKKIVRDMMVDFLRLMNKFNKLEKQPIDFGTGDLLYPSEIHTIDEIGKQDGQTVTGLCKRFGVTKGAVSQIVGKLSRKGYVHKIKNKISGKEILLSLTVKGLKVYNGHIKMHDSLDDDFAKNLKDINIRQVEQFRKNLKMIEDHMDKYLNLPGT